MTKETPEEKIARDEIQAATENLIHTVQRHKAAVAGFVWGADPPVLFQFGNVKETGADLEGLFKRLCAIARGQQAAGMAISVVVKPPA